MYVKNCLIILIACVSVSIDVIRGEDQNKLSDKEPTPDKVLNNASEEAEEEETANVDIETNEHRKVLNFVPHHASNQIAEADRVLSEITDKPPNATTSANRTLIEKGLDQSKEFWLKLAGNDTKEEKSDSLMDKMKNLFKADSNATAPATPPTAPTPSKTVALKPGRVDDDFLYGEELLKHHQEKDDSDLWKNLQARPKSEIDPNLSEKERLMKQMKDQIELEAKNPLVKNRLAKKAQVDMSKHDQEIKKTSHLLDLAMDMITPANMTTANTITTATAGRTPTIENPATKLPTPTAGHHLSYRLKGIRGFVSAELFEALSDAGQGDRILIASSSFPSASVAKLSKASLIRMDALSADQILEEIMKFIKVDLSDTSLIMLDTTSNPEVLKHLAESKEKEEKLRSIVEEADGRKYKWTKLEMDKFKIVAQRAVAIIQTGDPCPTSNLILTKGLMLPTDNIFGGKAT